MTALVACATGLLVGVLIGLRIRHRRFLTERRLRLAEAAKVDAYDRQAFATDLDLAGPAKPKTRFVDEDPDAPEQRPCDNRCGTPARWVWDDGVPHAACDGCVDLWHPGGIDLLVVTDLEAVGDACPGCGGTLMTLDDGSRWCVRCTSFWDRPDIGSWPELADPDTPDTAPRTVPGTRQP